MITIFYIYIFQSDLSNKTNTKNNQKINIIANRHDALEQKHIANLKQLSSFCS